MPIFSHLRTSPPRLQPPPVPPKPYAALQESMTRLGKANPTVVLGEGGLTERVIKMV